jgi:zinc-ribbon domain
MILNYSNAYLQGSEMAIAQCRECGTEVSDQAKTCPKCGVSAPVKKTSFLVKLILGVIGIAVLGNVVSGLVGESAPRNAGSTPPVVPQLDPKEQALNSVRLEKFGWKKGGFDNIMMLSTTIKNEGTRDVKDIEIKCKHASNSGTKIDSNTKVIFEVVKAGKTLRIKDFSMGFIHSQAASTSCDITDLVLL